MATKAEKALLKFSEGYNCAQSVFHSFCDDLPFDKDMALRLACGFGAGMGRKGEVCGAVSGGIMVIGARFGRGEKDGHSATETAYAKTRAFMDEFSRRRGTVICRELLNGVDLMSEEGQRQFGGSDLFNRICRPCVSDAVTILEDILR